MSESFDPCFSVQDDTDGDGFEALYSSPPSEEQAPVPQKKLSRRVSQTYRQLRRSDEERASQIVAIYPGMSQRSIGQQVYDGSIPSKMDKLQRERDACSSSRSKSDVTLATLREMNIIPHVISYKSPNLLAMITNVVNHVSQTCRICPFNPQAHCLLYRDQQNRLYNLIIQRDAAGPISQFESLLSNYSTTQALMAFVVLCRSLSCVFEENQNLRPAYLSLVLGLVLYEEIAYSWLNAGMMVRAIPSVSGFTLTNPWVGNDWLRKMLVFWLALAGAATGTTQKYMTLAGISLACIVILANLGARSWLHLRLRPLPYCGFGADFLGFVAAFFTGLIIPHLSNRSTEGGGPTGLESMLTSAVIVLATFWISAIDQVQEFVVVGSGTCSQRLTNISVGIWWSASLLLSMIFVVSRKKIPEVQDEDTLLQFTHTSPVGQRVPNLPDFVVDPIYWTDPVCSCTIGPLVLGTAIALGVIGWVVYLTFFNPEEGTLGDIFG